MVAIITQQTTQQMINKIFISIACFLGFYSFSQEEVKPTIEEVQDRFLVSLHYTGNLSGENFVGDNYTGVIGLDAKYNVFEGRVLNFHAGISLDFLKAKQQNPQFNFKNALLVNPNIGIEAKVTKSFRPFLNVGYSFFSARYTFKQMAFITFDPNDPAFYQNVEGKEDLNSISINPGIRFYLEKVLYFQADYKYLPIETNLNGHLFAIGIGFRF